MLVITGWVVWISRLQICVIINEILLTLKSILSIRQHLQLLISFLDFGLQRSYDRFSIFNLEKVLHICDTHVIIILTYQIQQLLVLDVFLLPLLPFKSLLLLFLIQFLLLFQLLLWVIFIVFNIVSDTALNLCLFLVWFLQLDLLEGLILRWFLL